MFKFALGMVEKTRCEVCYANHLWQIDVYSGPNCGLVVAEVELRNCNDHPRLPEWVGPEITGSPVYSNRVLAMGVQPKEVHPKIESGAEERTSVDTRI